MAFIGAQLEVGVVDDGLFCVVLTKFDIAYKKTLVESSCSRYLVRPKSKLQTRHCLLMFA